MDRKVLGETSIKFGYTGFFGNQDIVALEGHNITVCMDLQTNQKKRIPDWLREKLVTYQKRCEKESSTAVLY